MFNMPFNSGKFNVTLENNNMHGNTTLGFSGKAYLSVKKHFKAEADLIYSGNNRVIVIKYFTAHSDLIYSGALELIIKKFFAGSSTLVFEGSGYGLNLYGYDEMLIQGLIFRPGDELRIDTEEMTVMLNGQDVTYCFSPDSDFFHIQPGENLLVFEDNASARNIEIKYLWRDKWL